MFADYQKDGNFDATLNRNQYEKECEKLDNCLYYKCMINTSLHTNIEILWQQKYNNCLLEKNPEIKQNFYK